jgi:hypothetical protein
MVVHALSFLASHAIFEGPRTQRQESRHSGIEEEGIYFLTFTLFVSKFFADRRMALKMRQLSDSEPFRLKPYLPPVGY